ncbi:MAG: hypothetical protein R2911_00730 [Caldilineaceae bacterium]
MPAGYSGRATFQKLGIKPESTLTVVDAPAEFATPAGYAALVEWTDAALPLAPASQGDLDFIHLFVTGRRALAHHLPTLMTQIKQNGMIWVSWPKKAAKVPTDVTEDVVRAVALPLGLVDVKVAAINAVWSGLKLVIRKEHRK